MKGSQNVYNSSDPETLLRLKRQEADALLDVIRSFNSARNKPEHMFKIAQNTLLAQLGVLKMRFIYRNDQGLQTGINWGFGEFSEGFEAELPEKVGVADACNAAQPRLCQAGVESIVAVKFRNEVGAWFLVADFFETENEKKGDLIFIETLANLLSAALENRYLVREIVRQETVARELEVAEKIQKGLLATEFPDIRGASVSAHNVPHSHIGGDFYDVIPRGDLGFFICIADVAGKGIGAALLMANLQAQVRALILSQNSLEAVIRKLHENLLAVTQGEQFVTLFIAHVRTRDHEIDYINAGHNPPYLVRQDGIHPLTEGTIPLGIIDLPSVSQGSTAYHPDDVLFLYTDGLVEQANPSGELFDEKGVLKVLEQIREFDPEKVIMEMELAAGDFAQGTEHSDDVTMVAVKFK
ncbi:MAG: PP2C family protein-serine/threonine phosphatase [Bacteroidia bacterium]|nr:PP2C family protein-serine/threonine phosphatase [Bacteroidia bacterium]